MRKTKRKEKIGTLDAQYVCTFRPEPEGGYTVRCPALPEIVSYGASLEEARPNAREAIELCLEIEDGPKDSLEFVGIQRITVAA